MQPPYPIGLRFGNEGILHFFLTQVIRIPLVEVMLVIESLVAVDIVPQRELEVLEGRSLQVVDVFPQLGHHLHGNEHVLVGWPKTSSFHSSAHVGGVALASHLHLYLRSQAGLDGKGRLVDLTLSLGLEDDLALHLLLGSLVVDSSLLDVSALQRKCLAERHVVEHRALKERMQPSLAKPAFGECKLIELELASIQQLSVHLVILLRGNDGFLKLILAHLINNRVIQRLDVIFELFIEQQVHTDQFRLRMDVIADPFYNGVSEFAWVFGSCEVANLSRLQDDQAWLILKALDQLIRMAKSGLDVQRQSFNGRVAKGNELPQMVEQVYIDFLKVRRSQRFRQFLQQLLLFTVIRLLLDLRLLNDIFRNFLIHML